MAYGNEVPGGPKQDFPRGSESSSDLQGQGRSNDNKHKQTDSFRTKDDGGTCKNVYVPNPISITSKEKWKLVQEVTGNFFK